MKSYFCFVQVRPNSVPELRILTCEGEASLAAALGATLKEWPVRHLVEVTEGDRLVMRAPGYELEAAKLGDA